MIPGVYRNCHHVCTWSVYRSTMEDIQLDDRVGRCRTYCKRIGLSTRHSKNSHNTSQKEREVGIDLSFRYHGYHGITIGYGSRGDRHAVTFGGIHIQVPVTLTTFEFIPHAPGAPTAIAFNNPKLRKSCMESRTF